MKKVCFYAIALVVGIVFEMESCGSKKTEQPLIQKQATFVPSAGDSALLKQAQALFKPLPTVDEMNSDAQAGNRIALGKELYYDPILSKQGNNSCNSCHNLDTYGVDNMPVSKGDAGNLGTRNSPTVLNSSLQIAQFWDGRAKTLEEQAGMPVLNPVEMAMPSEAAVIQRLSKSDKYKKMFKDAFPDEKNPINYFNVGKSIGAFERILLTPCRFDNYLKGDITALSADERAGLKTFIDAGCASCHQGVNLGGGMFQKFGVYADYRSALPKGITNDEGRKDITKNAADKDVFKVPVLRNIQKTGPYFHDGSVSDLSQAVKIMGQLQLNKQLSDAEVKSIVTFLDALTGEVPQSAKPDR